MEDAVTVAEVLTLDDSVVNHLALNALESFGMPGPWEQDYITAEGRSDHKTMATLREHILAWARTYAKTHPLRKAQPVKEADAIRHLCSLWSDRVRRQEAHSNGAFEFARFLYVAGASAKTDEANIYVLETVAVVVDEEELTDMIHRENGLVTALSARRDLPKALAWVEANLEYCFFHPEERTLKLDADAREARVPSAKYRAEHPWGKSAGPNKTDPKKKPVM
jgi:hypothetical protein